MNGTYDEDVTLPNYVSLKGQGFYSTTIDGRVTVASGSYVEDLHIYPTGSETIAVVANPSVDTSYFINIYAVINTTTNAPTYVISYTGSTDFRIYNSFLYGRNSDTGGSAATYILRNNGGSGDLEVQNTHLKSSCGGNSNCYLALNDATASGSDIIVTGSSWSVFNDTSPVGAVNNNASGQIKLQLAYENDSSDNAQYTTSGTGVVINPIKTGSQAIALNEGFTSGSALNMSFLNSTTLTGTLNGFNLDLSTNIIDGNYQVKGLNLTLPDSGTSLSYGLYISGEDANYFSGNVGIGTTAPGQNWKSQEIFWLPI